MAEEKKILFLEEAKSLLVELEAVVMNADRFIDDSHPVSPKSTAEWIIIKSHKVREALAQAIKLAERV